MFSVFVGVYLINEVGLEVGCSVLGFFFVGCCGSCVERFVGGLGCFVGVMVVGGFFSIFCFLLLFMIWEIIKLFRLYVVK